MINPEQRIRAEAEDQIGHPIGEEEWLVLEEDGHVEDVLVGDRDLGHLVGVWRKLHQERTKQLQQRHDRDGW